MTNYEKEQINGGWKIVVYSSKMTDADWVAISELLHNEENPVREMVLHLPYDPVLNSDVSPVVAGQGFQRAMQAIAKNKALSNFELNVHIVPEGDVFFPSMLQALKENKSIKQLQFVCTLMQKFEFTTAKAILATLQNNNTVRDFTVRAFTPRFTVECVAELLRVIKTSQVDHLKIEGAEEQGFQLLMKSLPNHIVQLDLSGCQIMDDDTSPDSLQAFVNSNRTLKELVLPWYIASKVSDMTMGDNPLKITE